MFIKFDDLDMLDFFENEPLVIGEKEEAKFIYSIKDSRQFSMTLVVDTYAKMKRYRNEWNGVSRQDIYNLEMGEIKK